RTKDRRAAKKLRSSLPRQCAKTSAKRDNVNGQNELAELSCPVTPQAHGMVFGANRGKFKPNAAVCHI
ncbi:MAG: hypothetical protein WBZ51_10215, partial [Xanthobacteraceae bacterium]